MSKKDRVKILSVSIHDCEVQTFRSGGPGGQNQNKRDTGVRVIHPPSGAKAECREHRTQYANKRQAFIKMVNSGTFKAWMYQITRNLKTPEEIVERDMAPENILVETRDTGKWAPVDPDGNGVRPGECFVLCDHPLRPHTNKCRNDEAK